MSASAGGRRATDALAAGHGGGFGGSHMGGGFRGPLLNSVPSAPPPVFNQSSHILSPASPGSVFGNDTETILIGLEALSHAPSGHHQPVGGVSWKYSSIAYSLILKDVGVLLQTLYLMAIDMGLGGCAIGSINIDLFAKMTGLEFHVEGPVGLFALGRGADAAAPG
jgi:hypothetical protein